MRHQGKGSKTVVKQTVQYNSRPSIIFPEYAVHTAGYGTSHVLLLTNVITNYAPTGTELS